MKLRQTHPIEVAAAKADISRATGYRISQDPRLPSQKAQPRERRRPDPLEAIFDAECAFRAHPARDSDLIRPLIPI
jgi:hypothetical protein